jgi:hypothetical protein
VRFAEESAVVTFREVLLELMDLPGASYSCVADRVSGTLLGEVGVSSVAPGVVMEWGGGAAAFLASSAGDGLDDLMITSHRSYHLVRPVAADARQWLMIYLCLDRGRSNLALARRELAAPQLHKRLSTASVGPPPRAPVGPPDGGPRGSAPAAVPGSRNGASPAVALLSRVPTTVRGTPAGPPGTDQPRPDRAGSAAGGAVGGAGGPVGGAAGGAAAEAAGAGTRLASSSVPLPRRAGPSRVPPPLPAPAPVERVPSAEQVPVQSWATDVGTMRRLLTALRSLS